MGKLWDVVRPGLKPCPGCGWQPTYIFIFAGNWRVGCQRCIIGGPAVMTRLGARIRWNLGMIEIDHRQTSM